MQQPQIFLGQNRAQSLSLLCRKAPAAHFCIVFTWGPVWTGLALCGVAARHSSASLPGPRGGHTQLRSSLAGGVAAATPRPGRASRGGAAWIRSSPLLQLMRHGRCDPAPVKFPLTTQGFAPKKEVIPVSTLCLQHASRYIFPITRRRRGKGFVPGLALQQSTGWVTIHWCSPRSSPKVLHKVIHRSRTQSS